VSTPLTLPEVAELLGVHYMTAYRYVRTGRLAATKSGTAWLVDPAAVEAFRRGEAEPAPRQTGGASLPRTAKRLEARLLAGDRAGALEVVDEALAGGATLSQVEVDLIATALRSIGARWHDGELSVGDEHRATVVAQHVLAVVSSRFARRGRRRGTVVIGAAPGDDHQIPVTIAADHLRAAGYEVVDFGVDTPPEAFAEAAAGASAPVAVVVGATMPDRLPAVRRVVRAVRAAAFAVPVLVGGAAIGSEQVARSLGADGWTGPDAPALVTSVEEAAAASPDDEDDAEG
jgi:excisionase family DNA binding protein